MNDAAAAMALLGEVLTWTDEKPGDVEDDSVQESALYETDKGFQLYGVYFNSEVMSCAIAEVVYLTPLGIIHYQRTMPDGQEAPRYYYLTVAQAKAACEIHAVTGAFPPAQSPVLVPKEAGNSPGPLPSFPDGMVYASPPGPMDEPTTWEWYYGAPDDAGMQWWTFTGTTYYEIFEVTRRDQNKGPFFIASCDADPDTVRQYPSLADAKVACERRQAVGKWDT